MTDSDRIRRVAILCCHCVRNIAYYRAGTEFRDSWKAKDFWRNANSNFLDIAVLEWCKLFTDRRGKHSWKKVVPNPDSFMESFYEATGSSEEKFSEYIQEMKTYRNRSVAHLDEDKKTHIPRLETAIHSTVYLYNCLAKDHADYLLDAPSDLQSYYNQRLEYAHVWCKSATGN